MSPYGYDYSLAPSASTGWRPGFATVMTVGAIVAISAISGAAVALNLLGPAGTTADRPATVASAPVAQTVTPPSANAHAIVARSAAQVASVRSPSRPAAAPAPQPAQAVVAVEAPPAAHVAESELTFTRGYARRHAIQTAAEAPKSESPTIDVARVETYGQFGRPAKSKPKAIARANPPQDQRRVAEAREEFSRFDQPDKFDFARHQALAFGDPRDPRANRRPPPQGGLFGNSPSGFFGGLF